MDKVEDPEMMLDQARRDMMTSVQANREKAIAAITQRNQLEKMLADNRAKSDSLNKQAETALKQNNRDLALQIMREKQNVDATIAQIQPSYDQATTTVENVKVAMRRQEEVVKKRIAESLALKAQWKQAQIQNSIAKALDGLNFEDQFETSSFGAASERIKLAQSEASARSEMQNDSIQGKVMAMQDQTMNSEAESELQKMEERLGMKQSSVVVPDVAPVVTEADASATQIVGNSTTTPPVPGEAEKALEELEQKLKNSN